MRFDCIQETSQSNSFKAVIFFSHYADDGRLKPKPRNGNVPEPNEYKCLVRATLGNKKITTVVRYFYC